MESLWWQVAVACESEDSKTQASIDTIITDRTATKMMHTVLRIIFALQFSLSTVAFVPNEARLAFKQRTSILKWTMMPDDPQPEVSRMWISFWLVSNSNSTLLTLYSVCCFYHLFNITCCC